MRGASTRLRAVPSQCHSQHHSFPYPLARDGCSARLDPARTTSKLDDKGAAHLIALACSQAPEGQDHWTLRLLGGKVVELGLTQFLMAESGVSVFGRRCLGRRNPDEAALRTQVQAVTAERNAAWAAINWRFTTPDARRKLRRLYATELL